MTIPKPHKKPLSRDKATLHAQIRALQKERDVLKTALIDLLWIVEETTNRGMTMSAINARKLLYIDLANAGENT